MQTPLDHLNGDAPSFEASIETLREAALDFIAVEMAGIVHRSASSELPDPSDTAVFAELCRGLAALDARQEI